MFKRANSCCGCWSIVIGVKVILILHLLLLICLGLVFGGSGPESKSWVHTAVSPSLHGSLCYWSYAGILIVSMAMWGLQKKHILLLRSYLCYLCLTGVLAEALLCRSIMLEWASRASSTTFQQWKDANRSAVQLQMAWSQLVTTLSLLVLAVVFLYVVFIVWSYCEEEDSDYKYSYEDDVWKALRNRDEGHFAYYAGETGGVQHHDPATCSVCRKQREDDLTAGWHQMQAQMTPEDSLPGYDVDEETGTSYRTSSSPQSSPAGSGNFSREQAKRQSHRTAARMTYLQEN